MNDHGRRKLLVYLVMWLKNLNVMVRLHCVILLVNGLNVVNRCMLC